MSIFNVLIVSILVCVILVIILVVLIIVGNTILFRKGNIFLQKPESELPKHPIPKKPLKKIIRKSIYAYPELLEESYDAIVIGGGISGMVASGILTKAGKKVLLLESHKKMGGMTHCFKKESFKFCAGVQFVYNLTADIHLVSDGLLEHKRMSSPEVFEIGDRMLVIDCHLWKHLKKLLAREFPKEKDALDKYMNIVEKTALSTKFFVKSTYLPFYIRWLWWLQGKFSLYHKYGIISTKSVLDSCCVKEPLLRWYLKDYVHSHTNPNISHFDSFSIHARHSKMFLGRKSVVSGPYGVGGDNFVKTIIPNLVSRGSQALCGADVVNILLRNNEAIGVELRDGKKVFAENIISSIGVANTLKLLPKKTPIAKFYKPYLKENPYTGYLFVVFLGFDRSPEDLGLTHGIHVLQSSSYDRNNYFSLQPPNFEGFLDSYSFTIYALETLEDQNCSSSSKEKGSSQIQIVCPINPDWFKLFEHTRHKGRGSEYGEVKETLTSLILEIVFERFPDWVDHVAYIQAGTNLTFQHYCRTPRGAGFSTCQGYKKMNRCVLEKDKMINPMKNLYVVGADTFECGIGGQMFSCMHSCGKILKRNLYADIIKARKCLLKKEV